MSEKSQFGTSTYYRHEKDKQPGGLEQKLIQREDGGLGGDLVQDAETLRNGKMVGTDKSYPQTIYDEAGEQANAITQELLKCDWKLSHFTPKVCESIAEKNGFTQPAMVYAVAQIIIEEAERTDAENEQQSSAA